MEQINGFRSTLHNNVRNLYRLCAAAVLVLLLYSLATMVIVFGLGGQPPSVEETFAMLQENRIIGLLRLDLLTAFCMPLYYVMFLGFLAALWRRDVINSVLAMLLATVGLTLFLATPSVFSYLFLSDQYAAATSAAQRSMLLAAGEAIYASDMWHGTGAMIGGLLLQTGLVMISIVMLRDKGFGRATAVVGILTHSLDLAHIIAGFFAPEVGNLLMSVGGTLYLAWFPMIAAGFLRMARTQSPALQAQVGPSAV